MNINIQHIISLVVISFLITLYSCDHNHKDGDSHDHQNDDNHAHSSDQEEHADDHPEGIFLTATQIKSIGLEFGELSNIKINDYVKASGTLGVPPSAYSSVSPKSEGIISGNKKFVEGHYIKKGEHIAYIENPNFISKQQEYLENKVLLKFKKLELNRQQTLINENAGITKKLENAEAELSILIAKTKGIEKQLSYLGISTQDLTPDNIKQQISIISPMSGYITSINMHNGMYAQPTISLMEIIATDHLHLELNVFEKDIAAIKNGQKISYTLPSMGSKKYDGEVSVIGKEFDSTTKTLRIHGHLEGSKPPFVKDLFINAKIWLNDSTKIAIQEESVIKDGSSYIIYAANKMGTEETKFEKIMVIPGVSNDGFTSIKLINEIPEGMKVVTKGAYYVYAQSKAGELKHEH